MIVPGLEDLVEEAHFTAVSKGWHETDRPFTEALCLVHSEVSEAVEEYRTHGLDKGKFLYHGPDGKPEGIAAELADVLIRIADTCGRHEIPLATAVAAKLEYNHTRPHRHGGRHA